MKCWVLTLTTLCLGVVPGLAKLPLTYDMCARPSHDGLAEATMKDSLPKDRARAGNYSLVRAVGDSAIRSPLDCAEACCKNVAGRRCDVALYRPRRKRPGRGRCYLLHCNPRRPHGCDPVTKSDDPHYQDAVMIRLRRTTAPAAGPSGAPKAAAKPLTPPRDRLCSPDNESAFCPKGELCRPISEDGSYICICPKGRRRAASADNIYGKCVPVTPPVVAGHPTANNTSSATSSSSSSSSSGNVTASNATASAKVAKHLKAAAVDADHVVTVAPKHSVLSNASTVPAPQTTGKPSPPSNSTSPSTSPTTATITSTTAKAPVTSSVNASTTPATKRRQKPKKKNVSPVEKPLKERPGDKDDESPTENPLQRLTILLQQNYTIQLPKNELTLNAKVQEVPHGDVLTYHWSLVSNPDGAEKGIIDGKASPNLHLSKLIAGDYVFKLVVKGRRSYGETTVKVAVLPPKRINKPPVAIVKSKTEVVQQPNNLVLDGTRSSDDDRVVSYNWEEVSGPLVKQDLKGTDKGILELKGLKAGHYVFKLTVTDSDGATDSTQVNVTVLKQKDYPPTANAGQTVVLQLPKNSVTLNGNASTDDHGIRSYEWVKIGNDKLTADMQGTREPLLRLSKLEQGDYEFQLKVTDTAGQSSTATVKVYVNPRQNVAPTANAGGDKTVTLPLQETTLDGSKSEDDDKIVKYEWTQISGPHALLLKKTNQPKVGVSNLKMGRYKFRLIVWDKEGLRSESTAVLTVQESHNLTPKAKAGPDQIVLLPKNLVRLDGSSSWDDKGIVSYHWTRTDESLAAGTVLNKSDHLPVLLLTDLVPGNYGFNLEVADAEGLRHSDRINLIVKEDTNLKNVLEIRFKGNLNVFTEANKADLINQFKLLLSKAFPNGEIQVHVERVRQVYSSGSVVMRFFVTKRVRSTVTVLPGREVLAVLRRRLSSGVSLLDLAIERVDTAVCQSNCSGHGQCHPLTRECVCETFWMENSLRVRYGDGEHNCDWSVVYVIVLSLLGVLLLAAVTWLVVWCRRRLRRPRTKRHQYTLLNEFDEKDGGLKLASLPHRSGGKGKSRRGPSAASNGPQSGMVASESDLTSDEEDTIFVNKRPLNGGVGSTTGGENKAYLRSNGVAGAL